MPHKIAMPVTYNEYDQALVRFQIALARSRLLPYSGKWHATWLLADFDAPQWSLRTPETRREKGKWKGTYGINWDISLANDTRLTDAGNSRILLALKKAVFLIRTLEDFGITMTLSHVPIIGDLLSIVRWLFQHEEMYFPAEYGFALVDGRAVQMFMKDYIEGGAAWALRYPHEIVTHFYRGALKTSPSKSVLSNVYHVPLTDRAVICDWLEKNGFYIPPSNRYTDCARLSRVKIAELIMREPREFTTDKMTAFLRQFETDLLAISDVLLVPADGSRTEYLSHRTLLIHDVINTPLTFTSCSGNPPIFKAA
jgi:hypothetical protein